MAYEQKDNSGVLFKNDRKERDTHPDYSGNAMIDGTEYYISAWVKDGKRGKFFSLAFKPKQERVPGQRISDRAKIKDDPRITTGPAKGRALDDEIPF